MKRISKITICCIFLLLLLLPTIQVLTDIFPEPQTSSENRVMATFPEMNKTNIDEIPTKIEKFYNDNFPFRAILLNEFFRFKLKQGQSPIPNVIVGNGRLYQQKSVQIYTGQIKIKEEELSDKVKELKYRYTYFKERGIKMYVMIVPASPEIYPESLPLSVQRVKETQTDVFCNLMAVSASEIPFIYVKSQLLSHKQDRNLYRNGDNHWNAYGAYYASEELLKLISKGFPSIPEQKMSNYNFTPRCVLSGNLVDALINPRTTDFFQEDTIYDVSLVDTSIIITNGEKRDYTIPKNFSYPQLYEQEFVCNNVDLPKIVIIRDSFFTEMVPFITPFFRESVLIWDAWQYARNFDIVEKEKPDVVVYEITENAITNILSE